MILLLTGCINPNGMPFTALNNKEERQNQYVEALHFYLSQTSYPIVFTENSGTDISILFQKEIESGRMEYITFMGNQEKERGKGYGECEILKYALKCSKLINNSPDSRIAKITGRLIIRNINVILRFHKAIFPKNTVFFNINSELNFSDSRLIIAPIGFYYAFQKKGNEINDSAGYYFEHALLDTMKSEKRYQYSPFFLSPQIEGSSGSTGYTYEEVPGSLQFFVRYFKLAISQRYRFKKLYH